MFWGLWQLPVCAGTLPDMSKFWYPDIGILVLVAWVCWLADCHKMLHCSNGRVHSLLHHHGHLKSFWFHNLAAGTALKSKRGWVLELFFRSSGFPLSRSWHVKDNLFWYVCQKQLVCLWGCGQNWILRCRKDRSGCLREWSWHKKHPICLDCVHWQSWQCFGVAESSFLTSLPKKLISVPRYFSDIFQLSTFCLPRTAHWYTGSFGKEIL